MQFSWWRNGATISLNLGFVRELSAVEARELLAAARKLEASNEVSVFGRVPISAVLPAIASQARGPEDVSSTDETLKKIEIFADLPQRELEAVSQRCSWRRYAAGEQILGHLDDSKDVYFVVEGKVRATVYSLTGKEVPFRDIAAGEVFGEYAAIDGQPRAANVEALEDSLIASLSADGFWEVLEAHREVNSAALKMLTRQIRMITERVFELAAFAVKDRIHIELLRLSRAHMKGANTATISPAPTQLDIALRITTHREAVNRELRAMTRSGLVKRHGGALIVADVDALERLVKGVLGDQL